MSINKLNLRHPITIPAARPVQRHEHGNMPATHLYEQAQSGVKALTILSHELLLSIFKLLPKDHTATHTHTRSELAHIHNLLQKIKSLSDNNTKLINDLHRLPVAQVKLECQVLIKQMQQKHHLSSQTVKPLFAELATPLTPPGNQVNAFRQNLNANIIDMTPGTRNDFLTNGPKAVILSAKILYRAIMFAANFQAMISLLKAPISTNKEIASNIGS